MIDLTSLPKEIQDRMELKCQLETSFENALSEDYTDIFFSTLKERSNPMVEHSYICTVWGGQGTGKSYSAISTCGVLDKKFNVDNIYFDIELLVNDRKKLKPNTAVLVDEQTRLYGMDSVRISIMIVAIKEQLRKKSIHMAYCSPTLKDEYHSSMYCMETMFTDKKEKCNYLAYKTNELQTLGYVMIPHPVNFVSRNLLLAYEEKKDMHLSNLLEGGLDAVQDRAEMVMKDAYFLKAEKMYIEARGYIPYKILVQIVEKLFPEFKGSVIVYELADRVKAEREISGNWSIIHSGKKKDEE